VCNRCELQLGYAIGVAEPVSIYVKTFGTEKVGKQAIIDAVKNNFDLTPDGIIKKLDLKKPIFQKTATY
jgi:S-adenosylmethionine synthetase